VLPGIMIGFLDNLESDFGQREEFRNVRNLTEAYRIALPRQ
jgi:hypothetical protein